MGLADQAQVKLNWKPALLISTTKVSFCVNEGGGEGERPSFCPAWTDLDGGVNPPVDTGAQQPRTRLHSSSIRMGTDRLLKTA